MFSTSGEPHPKSCIEEPETWFFFPPQWWAFSIGLYGGGLGKVYLFIIFLGKKMRIFFSWKKPLTIWSHLYQPFPMNNKIKTKRGSWSNSWWKQLICLGLMNCWIEGQIIPFYGHGPLLLGHDCHGLWCKEVGFGVEPQWIETLIHLHGTYVLHPDLVLLKKVDLAMNLDAI